ncbi:MAG: hypothetical protein NVSMB56_02400 [Pyrinomonadaceae bacterium]
MFILHKTSIALFLAIDLVTLFASALAQNSNVHNPTWWDKYQYIANNGATGEYGATTSVNIGSNVDVSNECGPQSETFITLNASRPKMLAGGSNEIFRLPMRGYFSFDGGVTFATPNTRVSTVSSNEHGCNGVFPCAGINYGNQQGDYEGLVSYGGISHPIWTDSRRQLDSLPDCRTGLAMEQVFTAKINGNLLVNNTKTGKVGMTEIVMNTKSR